MKTHLYLGIFYARPWPVVAEETRTPGRGVVRPTQGVHAAETRDRRVTA
jgi:hypothetical protein